MITCYFKLFHVTLIKLSVSLCDIPMFLIKYLTMHKVHKHAGVIRQLLYGCVYIRKIIH